jgi:hypothetical protein
VRKGDGLTQIVARQLELNPSAWGFDGDAESPAFKRWLANKSLELVKNSDFYSEENGFYMPLSGDAGEIGFRLNADGSITMVDASGEVIPEVEMLDHIAPLKTAASVEAAEPIEGSREALTEAERLEVSRDALKELSAALRDDVGAGEVSSDSIAADAIRADIGGSAPVEEVEDASKAQPEIPDARLGETNNPLEITFDNRRYGVKFEYGAGDTIKSVDISNVMRAMGPLGSARELKQFAREALRELDSITTMREAKELTAYTEIMHAEGVGARQQREIWSIMVKKFGDEKAEKFWRWQSTLAPDKL